MKILITGGAGFIGSHAVKFFSGVNNVDLCVIDKLTYASDKSKVTSLNVPLYALDIATLPWEYVLSYGQPDIIINFAAETHVDNSIADATAFIQSNYLGVYKLVDGVRKYQQVKNKKIFIIQISSDEVYGDLPLDSNEKFKEDRILNPNNPYSCTKAAADMMIEGMYHTYKDFDYTICRATNNYGEGQHAEKLLPTTIRSILNGQSIPVYGDGKNIREWLWVDDFIEGISRIVDCYASSPEKVVGQIFNFGSNVSYRNIDVIHSILDIMSASKDLISFVHDRPGHDRKYAMDWNKAKEILKWEPKKKFYRGLRDVIDDIMNRE